MIASTQPGVSQLRAQLAALGRVLHENVIGATHHEDFILAHDGPGARGHNDGQHRSANSVGCAFIDSNKVAAAFAKGMPLLENGDYKIHASRRDSPGVAEIHTKDIDIIHMLEGSAIFVTGGKVAEPKIIAPDEIRGKEIKGGERRRIGKGDVIVVPNGVPHWFKQVDAPLLYYVVKVSK